MVICARRDIYTRQTSNVAIKTIREANGIRYVYETPLGTLTAVNTAFVEERSDGVVLIVRVRHAKSNVKTIIYTNKICTEISR